MLQELERQVQTAGEAIQQQVRDEAMTEARRRPETPEEQSKRQERNARKSGNNRRRIEKIQQQMETRCAAVAETNRHLHRKNLNRALHAGGRSRTPTAKVQSSSMVTPVFTALLAGLYYLTHDLPSVQVVG